MDNNKIELYKKLKASVANQNVKEIKDIAQEIFDAEYELEEVCGRDRILFYNVAGNLVQWGWVPKSGLHS